MKEFPYSKNEVRLYKYFKSFFLNKFQEHMFCFIGFYQHLLLLRDR